MSDVTDPNAEKHGIVLPERAYDLLKDLDLIALPALGAASGGALSLYHAPAAVTTTVVGTIAILITLIGILLKISNVQYKANAKVAAAKAAAIVSPVVTVSPTDSTKVEVAADPSQIEVEPPSQ